jgi:hypothetical protein
MADIPPIPGTPMGAEPMKKSTGKVQPKKETVRINLPPKPSAAPTIKLPTLPPGGPTGASSAVPIQPSAAGAPSLRSSAAPATQSRAAAPAPATQSRPAPAAQRAAPVAAPTVSTFDKILAIAACVAALAAVGTTVWMMMILNTALGAGQ